MKRFNLPWYMNAGFIALLFVIGVPLVASKDPMLAVIGIAFIVAGIFIAFMRTKKFVVVKKEDAEVLVQMDNLEQTRSSIIAKMDYLQGQFDLYKNEIDKEREAITSEAETEKEELSSELDDLRVKSIISYVVEDIPEDITSAEIKNKISMIQLNQKEMIKNDKAVDIKGFKTKKELNTLQKQILKLFTLDCQQALDKMTISNIDATRNKIERAFITTNKIFENDDIQISNDFFKSKYDEMICLHEYLKKIDLEKEEQRAIKEEMREQAKAQVEINNEKKRIDKEMEHFEGEQRKLLLYLEKAPNEVEKSLYESKIKELQEQIAKLQKDRENVLEREANTRAGYVYIISNIGSFGEDVYKIGMTRRLEPMERVKELGDASVPFEFDVHAMIFSEDAPKLETTLHTYFHDNQVNKVNPRKEFFKVNLAEIEKVVKEKFNSTVEFTLVAKAEQYRETLRINKEKEDN